MLNNLINMFKKTWQYLLVALVVTIFLRYKFGAEFFDIFGVIIFGGLIAVGIYGLYTKKKLHDFILFGLIVLGIMGVLVDGWTSVELLRNYILGGIK